MKFILHFNATFSLYPVNTKMLKFVAYTDGACETLPRIGGWGWTADIYNTSIKDRTDPIIEWSDYGGLNHTTNNQMELTAMAEVLKFCNVGSDITIWSDSKHVLGGIVGKVEKDPAHKKLRSFLVKVKKSPQGWMNGWKTSHSVLGAKYSDSYWNSERLNGYEWYLIHQALLKHAQGGSTIHVGWVKGHSGIEGNEKADKLSNIFYSSKSPEEIDKITAEYNERISKSTVHSDDSPYYAVAKGKNPGICRDWNTCNAQVKGFPKAKYKKFSTKKEADEFIKLYS